MLKTCGRRVQSRLSGIGRVSLRCPSGIRREFLGLSFAAKVSNSKDFSGSFLVFDILLGCAPQDIGRFAQVIARLRQDIPQVRFFEKSE